MTALRRACAVGLAAASLTAVIVSSITGDWAEALLGAAWPLSNAAVGLMLTLRRPALLTGWIFGAIGFLASTGSAADALATRGLEAGSTTWWGVLSAWYGEWYWLPMIYTTLIMLPLLFPTGRPLPGRWRRATLLVLVVLLIVTSLAALQETLNPVAGQPIRNPIGIPGLGDVEDGLMGGMLALLTIICLITAAASLVVRYRRSRGVERQQLKWFTSAGVAMISGFILLGIGDAMGFERPTIVDATLFTLPPIAAGFAIFRYRLYAIDRIISRTVTYFLVTALLIGIYAGAVTVMTATLDPLGGESPFAVAVATLAAAAVFRPALTRIQSVVDRRFNRARYDTAQTVEGFRDRARTDVDLDRLCADLVGATHQALQPSSATIWLRESTQ